MVVVKQRLLVIVAALILALAVGTSFADAAQARMNLYEYCENPRMVNPELGGCPYGNTDPNSDVS